MTKRELIEALEKLAVPDTAIVQAHEFDTGDVFTVEETEIGFGCDEIPLVWLGLAWSEEEG